MPRIAASATSRAHDWLDRSPRFALAVSLAILAILGTVHHGAGYEYAYAFFYIMPVALAARYAGRAASLGVAGLAACIWFYDDSLTRHYSAPHIRYWNGGVRLFVFCFVVLVVSRLAKALRREHQIAVTKGEMISLVSHQFNNAITSINLSLWLIEEGAAGASSAELHQVIKRNVQTLQQTAQNFLNEARLASGHYALDLRDVDLKALIREAAQAMKPLSDEKKIQVVFELPPHDLRVAADPAALALVLSNLVSNAIKYTPAQGRVTIRTSTDALPPDEILVAVEDTGIGIARQELENLQSGFTRTESGKSMAAGFGLGLKLAHDMLQSHGSRLIIDSAPGKGSRFAFALPVRQAPPASR